MVTSSPSTPVPSRRGLPGLGVLVPFSRDPLGFLQGIRDAHGPRVHIRIVDHDVLFVDDPADIELVLVKQADRLHKDALYALLRPALGNGLVTSEDAQWKRNRKLAAPSFTARHVHSYAETMVRRARQHIDALQVGQTVELQALMLDITRDIALATLFGEDLTGDATPVAAALDVVMEHFVSEAQGIHRVLPAWLPTPGRRRLARAVQRIDETVYALLDERRQIGLGDDLVSRLLQANEDGRGFTATELRDEAVTAFLAGHETTALMLTYTVHLLGEHPEVVQRLVEEVTRVLGDRDPTSDDVAALPYLNAVLTESMRVLPPVCWIGREVQAPVQLPGFEVPAGWQILMAPWVTQRRAEWFDQPLAFRPERWLDEAFVKQLPRMAYMPFGAGPRVCIGKHLAMMEAVLVLAVFAQRAWLTATGPLPRLIPSITLRPSQPMYAEVGPGCARS